MYVHIMYIHICIDACIHPHIYIYIYMFMFMYIYIYIHTHTHTYIYIYIYIHIRIHVHVHVHVHVHTWLLWRLPRSRFDGIHAVTSLWRSIGFSRVDFKGKLIGKHRKHMGKHRKTMVFSNKNMGCSWISLRQKHWNSDKRSAPYVMGDDTSVLATRHFFGICSWDMSWTKIEVEPSAKSPKGPDSPRRVSEGLRIFQIEMAQSGPRAHFCWQFSCHVLYDGYDKHIQAPKYGWLPWQWKIHENPQFTDAFPTKTSIYKGFSIVF